MNTAVATSQPPVVAQRSPAATTKAEVKLVLLLAGGLVLLGAVLQLFITPGAVPFVVYTTLMTATLLATTYVVRGRLLDTFAGFRLAAVALTILGVASALGTLILQNKPEGYYRGELGAVQKNTLETNINSLRIAKESMISAESVIRDTDMAEEMSDFTKNQIMTQSATAMLAQANQTPNNVLTLLK